MKSSCFLRKALAELLLLIVVSCLAPWVAAEVRLERVPDGGIQPQAAVGKQGTVHLVYYKGNERNGNLFYTHRKPGMQKWETPIRVNSQEGSAIAVGSIRGAHLALGKDGRPHVAWMGSGTARPEPPTGGHPMLYTRLNDAKDGFEPQRNLIQSVGGLDGGGSIAANANGNVWVAWHGRRPESPEGEIGRAVYFRQSLDEGETFGPEQRAVAEPTGACGCCGMRAFADLQGRPWFLYRTANDESRDMALISPKAFGKGHKVNVLNRWPIHSCPMSSAYMVQINRMLLAATERDNEVLLQFYDTENNGVVRTIQPSGQGARKHPVIAVNPQGEILLAWLEDSGWNKAGTFSWQVFNHKGQAIASVQHGEKLPTWSLITAFAEKNGSFVLLH